MKPLLTLIIVIAAALPAAAESFKGYPCTQDCSGHKAGYAWAKQRGVTDPAGCGGKSKSFIEGCTAAAQESFDPDSIAPAAGDDMQAPVNTHDPFALQPFSADPFAPDALPGAGH